MLSTAVSVDGPSQVVCTNFWTVDKAVEYILAQPDGTFSHAVKLYIYYTC